MDGIPVLLNASTTGTALDEIDDYSAYMGIDESVIRQTGRQWKGVIDGLGYTPENALEIGSGSGALTLGLLEESAVQHLTATDVSVKFLRSLTSKVARFSTPVAFIACDANTHHFRSEAFDLVLGRSVLHHLLDYEETIAHCYSVLKPGGAAVFYEPVLEGQTITTLFMALMLRSDAMANGSQFSETDRGHIHGLIRNQMKSTFLRDRESLSKVEDKYIFEIEKLKQVGLDAGFTEVAFLNDPRGFGYWDTYRMPARSSASRPKRSGHFAGSRKSFPTPTASCFRRSLSLLPDTSCSVVDTRGSARASARGR